MTKTKAPRKIVKLTTSCQHTLIGTLLFGICPIVYNSSASFLRNQGLMRTDKLGNLVLTQTGMVVALDLYQHKSAGLVGKTRSKIARMQKEAV